MAAALGMAGCVELPEVDLEGPRVVRAPLHGPRTVRVPVLPELRVVFSEPLARDAVAAVALIPWDEVGRCDLDPICEKGSCEAGSCQEDPVRAATWRALARGETPEAAVPLERWLEGDASRGPDSQLVLRPARALAPHRRYSLLLGAGIRDRSGAPLEDDDGVPGVMHWDFVTGDEGSAGPEPRLAAPAAGAQGIPPNLTRVAFELRRPVALEGDEVVYLVDEAGGRVRIEALTPCDGWIPGTCVAGRPVPALQGDRWYRVEGSTLRDMEGRRAVPPHEVEWFRTASTPVEDPLRLDGVEFRLHGACAMVSGLPGGLREVELRAAERRYFPGGYAEFGVRVGDEAGPHVVDLAVVDLVGQGAELRTTLVRSAGRPALEITEILANAPGKESAGEFIELRVPDHGAPLTTAGLYLADLAWPEVLAALAAGEPPPGDALPTVRLGPGEVGLIVGSSFTGESLAPVPDDAVELRVSGGLTRGGLKNAGEPLSIYLPDPPVLVASYGDFIDTSARAFDGVSVVSRPEEPCDLAARWTLAPGGAATPGWVP